MSDGLKLISSILAAGSPRSLHEIDRSMLVGNEQEAYDFVRRHMRTYRELPSAHTVQEETAIRLPSATESLQYYMDVVFERYEYNQIRDRFAGMRTALAERDMAQVADSIHSMSRVIRRRRRGPDSVGAAVQIDEAGLAVIERLRLTRGTGGVSGIVTGWNLFDHITGGYQDSDLITWVGRMGLGKCMDPATPVIMHSGQVKRLGELKVGDQLMGPDSTPRTVLSTTRGRDPMFRITPTRGDSFVCNGAHILVLRCNYDTDTTHRKGTEHLYSVDTYNLLPKRVRSNLRLVRTAVNFPEHAVEVSPYYVGVWLGDGCVQNGRVSTIDPEIRQAVYDEADRFGMQVVQCEQREGFCPQYAVVNGKGRDHVIMDFLRRDCLLQGEKRIPKSYLWNSRESRLQLLAGLLDTDGSLHRDKTGFEFTTKFRGLRDDVTYLARSLGFCVTHAEKEVGDSIYQRLYITGDIHEIPTRLPRKQAPRIDRRSDVLLQGFTVESLGVGDYAGITLDKDHLYLLGDFTVTHNTYILLRQAMKAHDAGHSVLVVTTEMGVEPLARRYAALSLGLNPTNLKTGQVSSHMQRRIHHLYRNMAGAERFKIFAVGMQAKVDAITALCVEFNPDIVFIDGIYLLRPTDISRSANRNERVAAVYDEIRALNLDIGCPFIVTTQFNRQAGKSGKEGSLETIGFTDAVGTHSSQVIALKDGPTDDPKDSRTFDFLKGREGESGQVAINFKFAPLNMDELSQAEIEAEVGVTEESVQWMGANQGAV